MKEMYYQLVLAHKRTCNLDNLDVPLVPATYREAVTAMLRAGGYDADGNII